jgi:hypothetical protein
MPSAVLHLGMAMAFVPCRPVRRFRGENLKKGNFMHVPGRAWRISLRDNNQYEFLDEADVAQLIEGEPISLVDAVRAGDEFILAMGNCAQGALAISGSCRTPRRPRTSVPISFISPISAQRRVARTPKARSLKRQQTEHSPCIAWIVAAATRAAQGTRSPPLPLIQKQRKGG